MTISKSLFLLLVNGLFITHLLPAAETQLEPFQGAWKVVELTDSGVKIPQDEFSELLHSGGDFRIIDDQIVFHSVLDGRQYSKTLVVDSNHNPPRFDVVLHDETTGWGIYQFDGDQLTVCMSAESAKDRPQEFTSEEGSSDVLMVLRRDTSRPEAPPKSDTPKIKPRNNPASPDEEPEQEAVKEIKDQDLVPTDLKIALALVGTWKIPQEFSSLYVWFKQDGTFITSRDVPRIRTFSLIFFNAPVSSGTWTVSNGVLRLRIRNSVNSQRVGAGLEFAVQNLTPQRVVLLSHLGTSVGAIRLR